jgi:pimeloyl-ACP methyl ester carboxylesterase
MWLPFYQKMARAVDFLAPEHPGFGDTPRPDWLDGFDDLVLHYRDLLDAFGLDRVHLVGFSLGGWIAAELAVFYPERLRSLTLITPVGLSVPGHPPTDLFRVPPERIGQLLFNDRAEDYEDFLPDPHDVDAAVQGYAEFTTLALLAWNPRSDRKLTRRVSRIRCPALVVEPDEDRILPAEHCRRWADLLPDGRLERISGATGPTGHGLIMQEPDRAADTILHFVQQADREADR